MDDYKSRKQKGVVVKIDLEKAYDKTSWDFLDFVMLGKGWCILEKMGFRMPFFGPLLYIA